MRESIKERAIRISIPVLGTREEPRYGNANQREGLNRIYGLLMNQAGNRDFPGCDETAMESACLTCGIIGKMMCEVVRQDNAAQEQGASI